MNAKRKISIYGSLLVSACASVAYGQTGGNIPAVRSPLLRINYQLEQPAGKLARVELWYAYGLEGAWQLYPTEELSGELIFNTENQEGYYRFVVVAVDKQGRYSNEFFAPRPEPIDLPLHLPGESMVLVDFTPPELNLVAPAGQTTQFRDKPVLIQWSGRDENLGDTPVQIFYQQQEGEKWLPLARMQPAMGKLHWSFAQPLPQARFKVEIADAAGNRTAKVSEWVRLQGRNEAKNLAEPNIAQLAPPAGARPGIDPSLNSAQLQGRALECFRRGKLYSQRQEWQHAIYSFQEALDYQPDYVEARVNLANACYRLGKFEQARTEFEICRQARPDSASVLYNLGQTQIALGQFEPARQSLAHLLELNPRDWEAWVLYGDACAGLGQTELARKCWVRAAGGSLPGAVLLAQARLEKTY